MELSHIEDRIAWGRNRAARRIGAPTDAFRPGSAYDPLAPSNRYLRLHATFSPSPGNFEHAPGFGNAVYFGYFDSAYTKPGDYLVQDDRTFFVASQESLLPVLCVRTNRIISIHRPAGSTAAGGGYGGMAPAATTPVLTNWPVSVLGVSTGGSSPAGLPSESAVPQWTILIPPVPFGRVLRSDLVYDADGHQSVVVASEESHLGWRVVARDTAA